MQPFVMAVGAVVEAVAWRLVATRRFDVWRLMPVALAAVGIAAAVVRRPVLAAEVSTPLAAVVGLAAGLGLYVATLAFVAVAGRWAPFRRHVVDAYRDAERIPRATSILLSLAVLVPAEELFWRGLFQARLADDLGPTPAAVASWLAYVGANLPSGSLPIVAGAVVGGGLWTALWWWSGGMLASLASHMLWTGLMLALPPGAGREVGAA